MMEIRKRRVAIATVTRLPHEDEIVRGVLAYHGDVGRWRLVAGSHRAFVSFEDLDLSRVDGVISNFSDPEWAKRVVAAGVPAVNTSNRLANVPLPKVCHDEDAIGRMGAEYLLGRGFVNYAFLTAGGAVFSQLRLAGFRAIIETKAGLRCLVPDARSFTHAFDAAPIASWLQSLPKPVAIMAANDSRAHQLVTAAVEQGLRVPEEVAVLGVDNDEWVAAASFPPISSIATDGRQVGYRAAQLLECLMSGEPAPTEPLRIPPTRVVTRQSTDIVMSQNQLVSSALHYIQDNCMHGLSVENVLDVLGVSRRKLELQMKQAIGQSPREAITRAQIDRAKSILMRSDISMGDVAHMCGFTTQNHFCTVFKQCTGLTPSQFRHQRATRQQTNDNSVG